jgi:hypothetical protein
MSQSHVVQVSAPMAMEISSSSSSSLPVAQMLISTNKNKCPLDFADPVPEVSKTLKSRHYKSRLRLE